MFSAKNIEYFSEMEELLKLNDEVGLVCFIDQRMKELINLLLTICSNKTVPDKLELLEEQLLAYAFKYKECSLEELGADLCTLIGIFEIIMNTEEI